MLGPFIAFCVMVGLHWSIKSKGTIGSIIASVGVVLVVVAVLSLCGSVGGREMGVFGAVIASASPLNLVYTIVLPLESVPDAMSANAGTARTAIVIGAAIFAGIYAAISFGMHTSMKRSFMMTVRKLAGTR